jgi:hypothetical protein
MLLLLVVLVLLQDPEHERIKAHGDTELLLRPVDVNHSVLPGSFSSKKNSLALQVKVNITNH